MAERALAVVTGASSGIGFGLAKLCAGGGYALVICADEPEVERAAGELRRPDVAVEAVEADLGTAEGVETLWEAIGDRPGEILCANAGRGLGHAFPDQEFGQAKDVVDLNVTGTISLIHKVGRRMREIGRGRILIAGRRPGSFLAVYNGAKAFLESFACALRNELKETRVAVACLAPGPTATAFFRRADLEDARFGESDMMKSDPATVARAGCEAMPERRAGATVGLMNRLGVMFAGIVPGSVMAEMRRHVAATRRDRS